MTIGRYLLARQGMGRGGSSRMYRLSVFPLCLSVPALSISISYASADGGDERDREESEREREGGRDTTLSIAINVIFNSLLWPS